MRIHTPDLGVAVNGYCVDVYDALSGDDVSSVRRCSHRYIAFLVRLFGNVRQWWEETHGFELCFNVSVMIHTRRRLAPKRPQLDKCKDLPRVQDNAGVLGRSRYTRARRWTCSRAPRGSLGTASPAIEGV